MRGNTLAISCVRVLAVRSTCSFRTLRHGVHAALVIALVACLVAACSTFGAVYPPRPPTTPGLPVADPTPSRIVAHVTVTSAGLKSALESAIPKSQDGQFPLLKTTRRYKWERDPVEVSFSQGRIVIDARVRANVDMPVGSLDFSLALRILAEPVINSDYKVKLQSTDVKVTSTDKRLKVADHVAGVFDNIAGQLGGKLKEFSYDVRPILEEAYARVKKPIDLPVGDAMGCAELRVLGIEAGPTVVADGLEKDFALIVAPQVTLPCAAPTDPTPLPTLANVAQVPSGPFTVVVPIAARYDELTRALSMAFTDGKLFFSAEYPKLFLEKPELYESQGQLVLKLHMQGPVHKMGIDADLDGDIYLSGHISVVDNEVRIPDLEQTIETRSFFLSLKAMADGDKIRDQARAALRLDLGERLQAVRAKLSSEMTFGNADACFHGDLDKIEVTSAHAHGNYLRVYVAVTARAAATMPCAAPIPTATPTPTPTPTPTATPTPTPTPTP